jgi:hypothetical protein
MEAILACMLVERGYLEKSLTLVAEKLAKAYHCDSDELAQFKTVKTSLELLPAIELLQMQSLKDMLDEHYSGAITETNCVTLAQMAHKHNLEK